MSILKLYLLYGMVLKSDQHTRSRRKALTSISILCYVAKQPCLEVTRYQVLKNRVNWVSDSTNLSKVAHCFDVSLANKENGAPCFVFK